MGATGVSGARYLTRQGLPFAATDSRAHPSAGEALNGLGQIPCSFGGFACPLPLDQITEAVVSPGVSLDEPFLLELQAAGVPLIGDIELFARAVCRVPSPGSRVPMVIAITGSNGKSTVAALVAAMVRQAGRSVALGGNFGPPALDVLDPRVEVYVLELSSFQLALTDGLSPTAAVVLNLSADHI
ncbi:MAG: UDP-N-acetylmuramoyl-L-alanine--D-glutamate ligase, partial [Salinisphaera sp.]|nr:UDP-N-acetylmuramoyl-L-alanine--D-glutamate ligase [Salinisphaera sp.]